MKAHKELAKKTLIQKVGIENSVITAREYSHDDGPHAGMFLGGMGTIVFSRDLDGMFARWHLEPGIHINHKMEGACLLLHYKGIKEGQEMSGSCELNVNAVSQGFKRQVSALFPVLWEEYEHQKLPFKISIAFFSPFIPHDVKASSMPISFFDVYIEGLPAMEQEWEISVSLLFPNLLGWKAGYITSVDRTLTPYPAQTHAGNTCLPTAIPFENHSHTSIGVCQARNISFEKTKPEQSLEGQVMLFVSGEKSATFSREICYKNGQNRIEKTDKDQPHTLAWVKNYFEKTGTLPQSELSWESHWDEALGSAVAYSQKIKSSEKKNATFGLVFDCPITEFGRKRGWYTKYTEYFGTSGNNAFTMSSYALENKNKWFDEIYAWHKEYIENNSSLPFEVITAQINELYFLVGGGTAFVHKTVENNPHKSPILGDKEHFGLLEGFDVGYHYYNTVDLWVYAFPALSRTFPSIAESVFDDILNTVPLELPSKRMIYREGKMASLLVAGKIPHDMGSAPSDPWHDLNGYQMRDDSNQWLDHVPATLVSYFLHCKKTQHTPSFLQWQNIKQAFAFMLSQQEENGLPLHKAFGDSTWDNLGLKGLCTYTSTAVLATYLVIESWAKQFNDIELEKTARSQFKKAYPVFETELWTGEYYKACTEGLYANCIMADSLLWGMYVSMAGLNTFVPTERIEKHMKAVFTYNYKTHGYHGPLLICEPERGSFPPDGGDIGLQVNEVLVGSAWASVAIMQHFGLAEQAKEMAMDMATYQHKTSSLQFRTPAAWDNQKRFRAPLNMRPLSIWLLNW